MMCHQDMDEELSKNKIIKSGEIPMKKKNNMKNILKLEVLFTTVIDSNKNIVHCKIPNEDLIQNIYKIGLENSDLEYATAYIDTFSAFDQYDVSYVKWVRIVDIEKKQNNGEVQWKIKVGVLGKFDKGTFDIEFGPDLKMDTDVPKYVVFSNVNFN